MLEDDVSGTESCLYRVSLPVASNTRSLFGCYTICFGKKIFEAFVFIITRAILEE